MDAHARDYTECRLRIACTRSLPAAIISAHSLAADMKRAPGLIAYSLSMSLRPALTVPISYGILP